MHSFTQLYQQIKTHFNPDGPEQPPRKPSVPSVTTPEGAPAEPVENEGAVMLSRLNDVLLISELRSRAEQAEKELAALQQDIVRQVEAARHDAVGSLADQTANLERRAAEQIDAAVLHARAAAEQVQQQERAMAELQAAHAAEIEALKEALAGRGAEEPAHHEALARAQAEVDQLKAALAELQTETAGRVEQARRDADTASTTHVSELEAQVRASREAHALAEELFTKNQAELAEQHQQALAETRAEADRAQSRVRELEAALAEGVDEARQHEADAHAAEVALRVAEVEARGEAALKTRVAEVEAQAKAALETTVAELTARAKADLEAARQDVSTQVEQARREAEGRHQQEIEQLRADADVVRARDRQEHDERQRIELARVRSEAEQRIERLQQSEATLAQQLSDLETQSAERMKAAVRDAKTQSDARMAEARAEWEHLQEEAVQTAVAAALHAAQHRMETQLARMREDVTRNLARKLQAVYAKAEERRRRADEQAQAAAAQELSRVLEESLEQTLSGLDLPNVTSGAGESRVEDVTDLRDAATA